MKLPALSRGLQRSVSTVAAGGIQPSTCNPVQCLDDRKCAMQSPNCKCVNGMCAGSIKKVICFPALSVDVDLPSGADFFAPFLPYLA
jgi:hypothetical protein